jgi:hypothetical protein
MKGAHEAELGSPRGEVEVDDRRGETRLWASPSSRRPLLSNTLSHARQHYPWLARCRPLARPRHNPTFARRHTPMRRGGSWGPTKSARRLPQARDSEIPCGDTYGLKPRGVAWRKSTQADVREGLRRLGAGGVGGAPSTRWPGWGGRDSGGEAGRHGGERHARAGAVRLRRRGGRRGSNGVRRRRGGDVLRV